MNTEAYQALTNTAGKRVTITNDSGFHFEISPRQTGKTSRLRVAIGEAMMDGKTPILMAHSLRHTVHILDTKPLKSRVLVCTTNDQLLKTVVGQVPGTYRCFFDEWDIFASPPILSPSGYYCTTPCGLRQKTTALEYLCGVRELSGNSFCKIWCHAVRTAQDVKVDLLPTTHSLASPYLSLPERGYTFKEEVYPDGFEAIETMREKIGEINEFLEKTDPLR
jgi:hypothetical protein